MLDLRSTRYILSLCENLALQLMGRDLCQFRYLLSGKPFVTEILVSFIRNRISIT